MQLTDEQINRAAEIMYELASARGHADPMWMPWKDAHPIARRDYLDAAIAAAPHLQMPWSEPTEKEANECGAYRGGLIEFVQMRNEVLLGKKQNPRARAIANALTSLGIYGLHSTGKIYSAQEFGEMAAAALDKEK